VPALVLALDGCSPYASAALAAAGELMAESAAPARGGRSLLELVDDCFRAAGRRFDEVGTVAAVAGPGSFTGVRVTLATAMGLAPAASAVRLAGVSALAALALQAPPERALVDALVDALQGEWFHQRFARGAGGLRPAGAAARARRATIELTGDAVVAFGEVEAPCPCRIVAAPLAGPLAVAVSSGAAEALLEAELKAHYLRAPAVTPPRPTAR
jgi:tRNA threonylcarbamoyl adenosine modification protein YeaZ